MQPNSKALTNQPSEPTSEASPIALSPLESTMLLELLLFIKNILDHMAVI
jgi:hypothetical protein